MRDTQRTRHHPPPAGSEIADPYGVDDDEELELDRWLEEQARAARQVREDAEEAVWDVLQIYGEPIPDEVRTAAIENLIDAHYAAENAGVPATEGVFADYGLAAAWNALYAALPRPRTMAPIPVRVVRARAGWQDQRGSRTRRSTRTRGAQARARSDDPDPPLDPSGGDGLLPGGAA